MKFVLVVDRKILFPGLSPQGLLDPASIDRDHVERHAFFAEREFMEHCSHYKQIIPYITLQHEDHVLAYQRQQKHSETRLGGLWTVGFGGHVEPLDRSAPELREVGLLEAGALRELKEETGLDVDPNTLRLHGYINSERTDVSTVHFGLYYTVDLSSLGRSREDIAELVEAQAEPFAVSWLPVSALQSSGELPPAPEQGEWEDWTAMALTVFARPKE